MALLLATPSAARADAQSDEQAFSAATEQIAARDYAGAAERLLALVAASPSGELSDDALMKAAQLYEEHLGDPWRASELYQRVVSDHPQSRLARRAEHRLEVLRAGMGERGQFRDAMARYQAIVNRSMPSPDDSMTAIAEVETLLAQTPEFPRAAEATLWIAAAFQRETFYDEALTWYAAVRSRFAASPEANTALAKIGDIHLLRGEFDEAEAAYRELARAQPDAAQWLDSALAEVEIQRGRVQRARWAWLAVVLFVAAMLALARRDAGSWRGALRTVSRPPFEVVYLVPVCGGLSLVSLAANNLVAHAILFISAGALAITWISGAVAEGYRRRSKTALGARRAALHAIGAALAIAAICYLAMVEERLLDLLIETLRSGPE